MNVDKTHKLIRQYTVTDAAVHASQALEAVLLPADAGRDAWADSASLSEAIEEDLTTTGRRSRIQQKGYRNQPLTERQQHGNRCRTRIRACVEQIFGYQVTAMGGNLIRTVGLVRARLKIRLENLTYNFQRYLILSAPTKRQVA